MSDDGKKGGGGYGRPPRHSQFKKGQSGNPKGRPRKTKPTLIEALRRELESELDFPRRDGSVVRMTNLEAYVKAFVGAALKQPLKAFEVISDATGYAANDNGQSVLSEAQEAILKRALGSRSEETEGRRE